MAVTPSYETALTAQARTLVQTLGDGLDYTWRSSKDTADVRLVRGIYDHQTRTNDRGRFAGASQSGQSFTFVTDDLPGAAVGDRLTHPFNGETWKFRVVQPDGQGLTMASLEPQRNTR